MSSASVILSEGRRHILRTAATRGTTRAGKRAVVRSKSAFGPLLHFAVPIQTSRQARAASLKELTSATRGSPRHPCQRRW
eukprot:3054257-Pyramimonas_sp.AAC.1